MELQETMLRSNLLRNGYFNPPSSIPHIAHSLSNQETLPRKIRPQVESRWHSAWQEGCYWWVTSGGSLRSSWGTSLSWFCQQWYMKFTLKPWMRIQGLFWEKWLCRERSGFFNDAVTFSKCKETMGSKFGCSVVLERTWRGRGFWIERVLSCWSNTPDAVPGLPLTSSGVLDKSFNLFEFLFPLWGKEFEPGDYRGIT